MQRRLVSALEDLKLTADGTVRNTVGTVIQFKYGEDGIDPSRTVGGKAIDIDDLFYEVLPEDEAEMLIHPETKDRGDDYGTREKDEMEYMDEDGDGDGEDGDGDDYGEEGGE